MDLRLQGRSALVFEAGGGLGGAIARTLAGEVGRDGITANAILPGRIATQRIAFLDEQRSKREVRPVRDIVSASIATSPVGRYRRPQECGDAVAFLVPGRASFINGSVICVDGGTIQGN